MMAGEELLWYPPRAPFLACLLAWLAGWLGRAAGQGPDIPREESLLDHRYMMAREEVLHARFPGLVGWLGGAADQ